MLVKLDSLPQMFVDSRNFEIRVFSSVEKLQFLLPQSKLQKQDGSCRREICEVCSASCRSKTETGKTERNVCVVYSWASVWLVRPHTQWPGVSDAAPLSDHVLASRHRFWWFLLALINCHWIRWMLQFSCLAEKCLPGCENLVLVEKFFLSCRHKMTLRDLVTDCWTVDLEQYGRVWLVKWSCDEPFHQVWGFCAFPFLCYVTSPIASHLQLLHMHCITWPECTWKYFLGYMTLICHFSLQLMWLSTMKSNHVICQNTVWPCVKCQSVCTFMESRELWTLQHF